MKSIQCDALNIAYIGGGSRGWARTFMTDLALEPELGGVIRLYDIDKDAAMNNEIIGNRISSMPQTRGKWRYEATDTLEKALDGADFVIISVLPGTFEEMKSDVHLPERLGIYQSVGDTTGPGGIVRALRTIPIFTEFARAIRDCAPNAWVINYTNPMGLCLRALYHEFPGIRAFGCCHEVFGMQKLLSAIAARELGEDGITRKDICVNVLGLNHFTWFSGASYKNHDLFEMYGRFAEEHALSGFSDGDTGKHAKCFTSVNRVKFDLFNKYGWMAAAGDRHLAEFMPGDIYLKDSATAESWGFYLTPVQWRMEDLQRRLEVSTELATGRQKPNLTPSGEEGILLIKALCGLDRVVSNVNLPNTCGQISNLPRDTVAETNALFSANALRPVCAGSLKDDILGLTAPHVENQTEVLHAALEYDREAVYRAFGRDPLVKSSNCTEKELQKLVDDMIDNTIKYLPSKWQR